MTREPIRFRSWMSEDVGRPRRADERHFDVASGAGRRAARPLGRGQVDPSALRQPSRHDHGGKIFVAGRLIGYRERDDGSTSFPTPRSAGSVSAIGMVFQSFNLFRHLTALHNVMSGPVHVLACRGPRPRRLRSTSWEGRPRREGGFLPTSSQAASSSASRSPGRSRCRLGHAARRADERARSGALSGGGRDDQPLAEEGHTLMIATHEWRSPAISPIA